MRVHVRVHVHVHVHRRKPHAHALPFFFPKRLSRGTPVKRLLQTPSAAPLRCRPASSNAHRRQWPARVCQRERERRERDIYYIILYHSILYAAFVDRGLPSVVKKNRVALVGSSAPRPQGAADEMARKECAGHWRRTKPGDGDGARL